METTQRPAINEIGRRFHSQVRVTHCNTTLKSYELLTQTVSKPFLASTADAIQSDSVAYALLGSGTLKVLAGTVRGVGEFATEVYRDVTGDESEVEGADVKPLGELVRSLDGRLRYLRDSKLLANIQDKQEAGIECGTDKLELLDLYLRCIDTQREALAILGQNDFSELDQLYSDIELEIEQLTQSEASGFFTGIFSAQQIINPLSHEDLVSLDAVFHKLKSGRPLEGKDVDILMHGLKSVYLQHERLHQVRESIKGHVIDFLKSHPYVSKLSAKATAWALGGLLFGPMGGAMASLAVNKFVEEQLDGSVSESRVEQLASGMVEVLAGMAGGGAAGAVAAVGTAAVNEGGSEVVKEGAAFGARSYLFQLAGLPPSMAASSSVLVALASKKTAIMREMWADLRYAWNCAQETPLQAAAIFAKASAQLLQRALGELYRSLEEQSWGEAAIRVAVLTGPATALAWGQVGLVLAALSSWIAIYLTDKFFRSSAPFEGPASLENPQFTEAVAGIFGQGKQELSALEEVMLYLVAQSETGDLGDGLVQKYFEQTERLQELLKKES